MIIPVGDEGAWRLCRQSLDYSVGLLGQDCSIEVEVLPCLDIEHKGADIARNEGLARGAGEWVAWVDCDDEVEPNWASEILACFSSKPSDKGVLSVSSHAPSFSLMRRAMPALDKARSSESM